MFMPDSKPTDGEWSLLKFLVAERAKRELLKAKKLVSLDVKRRAASIQGPGHAARGDDCHLNRQGPVGESNT